LEIALVGVFLFLWPFSAGYPLSTHVSRGNSVTYYVADRSLSYFLFFLCLWGAYALYQQDKEIDRFFIISTQQQDTIKKQQEAIKLQTIYIDLLEKSLPPRQNLYNSTNPRFAEPL
jgi:hypothetical protein